MGHVRFIKNVSLLMVKGDEAKTKSFPSGRFAQVNKIIYVGENSSHLVFQDGWIAEDVGRDCYTVQSKIEIEQQVFEVGQLEVEEPTPTNSDDSFVDNIIEHKMMHGGSGNNDPPITAPVDDLSKYLRKDANE